MDGLADGFDLMFKAFIAAIVVLALVAAVAIGGCTYFAFHRPQPVTADNPTDIPVYEIQH